MTTKTLKVTDGMRSFEDHAAFAVQKAGEFQSTIHISCGNMQANAKSLMGMMTMQFDAEYAAITADGADEISACEALSDYLLSL